MLNWQDGLEDWLFQKSRSMPTPWGPALRIVRYPVAIIRDWLAGDIAVRAMSLAYTTLLSLVPLLAFSVSILKGLGARGDLHYILQEFFRPLGSASEQLTTSVLQFVANMRGDVLGSIGLISLVYTVVSTIQKVEASFNFVWRVERPRSFARRFTEYLSVMILGPILLAVAVGLLASAEHSPFAHWLKAIPPLEWLMRMLGQFVPYSIVVVVFSFMYAFIPNTRVQPRAAIIGGVSAGIIWALVGKVFTAVILYSSHMMAVYTGFAIVLTTLIWVYLSWLILLIGAQLAFYVQCPQYLRHGQERLELSGSARERAGMSVMLLIGRDHGNGVRYWTGATLAAELDLPATALAPVIACLELGGLIVATEKEQFLPARDPAAIPLNAVVDALRDVQPKRLVLDMRCIPAASQVVSEVEFAIHSSLGDRSLKDLILASSAGDPVTRPQSSSR